MKTHFYLNKQWSNALAFCIASLIIGCILLFCISFEVKPVSYWYPIISASLFVLFLIGILLSASRIVKEVEIKENNFILHFFFFESKKYSFEELNCYATAAFGGGRYVMSHSVILEFSDSKRYQVADPVIENYGAFLDFIRNSEFQSFGYIGQNNWRRKNKPFSKKWVVARNEIELEKLIVKKKGIVILYFYGILMLVISLAIIRLFIVFH